MEAGKKASGVPRFPSGSLNDPPTIDPLTQAPGQTIPTLVMGDRYTGDGTAGHVRTALVSTVERTSRTTNSVPAPALV